MAGELRRSRVVNNLKYFLTSSAFSRELYPKYTNALALVMSSSSWGVSAANKLPQGHLPKPGSMGRARLAATARSFAMALTTPLTSSSHLLPTL